MVNSHGEEITGTANDSFKFAQTYRDSDSGLDYAQARYYASGVGRFLTTDPTNRSAVSEVPQSLNRYAYVQGNPVNAVDPTGLNLASPGDGSGDCVDFQLDGFSLGCVNGGGAAGGGSTGGGGCSVSLLIGDDFVSVENPACYASDSGGDDDDEPVADCLSAFPAFQVGFVTAHYTDSVALGAQAGVPSTWILGWSAEESNWGNSTGASVNGNYFGWHGKGNKKCPPGSNTRLGCFTSYYASGETALFSTARTYFHYPRKTTGHVTIGGILRNQFNNGASAAQAFQAIATAGYNPTPSAYGTAVAIDIGIVQSIENCMQSLHRLP